MIRGIYQGWTGWRNLGDEAMLESCRRCLPHITWSAPRPFDADPGLAGRMLRSCEAAQATWLRSPAVLGGGTLINRNPEWLDEYRRLRRRARRPVPVFSPGVAHPVYWSRTSGWHDTRAAWRDALAELPEVGVRGPVSKRLLDEAGVRRVVVAGDPALVFQRRGPSPPPRRRIGINIGRSNGEMWGGEQEGLHVLADSARRLTAAGFEVSVFPVWDRDEAACREMAVAAGLPADAVDPLKLDPDAFVEYVAQFDLVVTLKLHAAVLASAAAVPFVAIEYRPKVRDFAESVGWGAYTFRNGEVDGGELTRVVRTLYDDLPAARARLTSRVDELAATFRAYAARMEQQLLS
jgi:polysaccharide pyruvyl transferase WcaK-like protein